MAKGSGFVYLLLGPEAGEKKRFLEGLYQQAVKESGSAEKYKFYPYDTETEKIIAVIRNPSLFGGGRFVVLANIEDFKKADLAQFAEYAKKPLRDVYLVMLSDALKADKIDKKLDAAVPAANKRVFWDLSEERVQERVRGFFQKEGLSIAPEAVERLLQLVENKTQELQFACEALAGFFNNGDPITEDDVDRLIIHGKEENVFTLFEKIARRDTEAALEAANKMALSPEGLNPQTLSGLLWQFRNLLNLKEMVNGGASPDEAMRSLRILGKNSQAVYRHAAQRFSSGEIKRIVSFTGDYDAALRQGGGKEMQKLLISSYLMACCIKGQRPLL